MAATIAITNSFYLNSQYGVLVSATGGSSVTVNLKNSLVTNNPNYGVYRVAGSTTVNVT